MKLIAALDFSKKSTALHLVPHLNPQKWALKVGSQMFTRFGPGFIKNLQKKGYAIFLDLKFHDIPSTVAKAVEAAAKLNVWMVNVHAAGGLEMMQAAKEALQNFPNKPLLIAVTVLTSDLDPEKVMTYALLAKQAGLDGVVCSANDVPLIRHHIGQNFLTVTPGIRLKSDILHDQKRVATPKEAFKNGADYLVIGRPITTAHNQSQVIAEIEDCLP